MPKVSNLVIKRQSGDSGPHYASWEFNEMTKFTTVTGTTINNSVRVGSLVSIASEATYYNGTHIPDYVKNDKWYVYQLKGDRAVINKNQSGSHHIMSPINVKYLSFRIIH